MLLPLRLIIKLQMPLSRKISISGLFTLAWICIIAAAIRCTQIGEANGAPSFPWLALWGTTETTVGECRPSCLRTNVSLTRHRL